MAEVDARTSEATFGPHTIAVKRGLGWSGTLTTEAGLDVLTTDVGDGVP